MTSKTWHSAARKRKQSRRRALLSLTPLEERLLLSTYMYRIADASQFGPGDSNAREGSTFLGAEFRNVSSSASLNLGLSRGTGAVSANGRIGFEVGGYADPGSFDANYEIDFRNDWEQPLAFGPVDIQTGLTYLDAQVDTISPSLGGYADFIFELSGSVSGRVEAYNPILNSYSEVFEQTLQLPSINVNQEVVSYNRDGRGDLKVFGREVEGTVGLSVPIAPPASMGIDFTVNGNSRSAELSVNVGASFLEAGRSLGSMRQALPSIRLASAGMAPDGTVDMSTRRASSFSDDSVVQTTLMENDLVLTNMFGPLGPIGLSATTEAGFGVGATVTALEARGGPELHVYQDFKTTPDGTLTYRFEDLNGQSAFVDVTVTEPGGQPVEHFGVSSISFEPGARVAVEFEGRPIRVKPEATFHLDVQNVIGLQAALGLDVDALKAEFSIDTPVGSLADFTAGPVWSEEWDLSHDLLAIPLFSKTFETLETTFELEEFIIGEGFTPSLEVTRTDDNQGLAMGAGTLRQAIWQAQFLAASTGQTAQTITLAPGVYTLETAGSHDEHINTADHIASGDLDIVDLDLTIEPTGPGVLISGEDQFRVFQVHSGASLDLSGLSVIEGKANNGAGILNSGTLRMTNASLAYNNAEWYGGAIFNVGHAELIHTTLTANSADRHSHGAHGSGFGGGISNVGSVVMVNSIVADNFLGTVRYQDGRTDNDLGGKPFEAISAGNMVGIHNGLVSDEDNIILGTEDPQLSVVHHSASNTFVHVPVNGSRAIDAALPGYADYDQNGKARPMGGAPNIGAVESERVSTVVTTLADIRNPFDDQTSLAEALEYAASRDGEDTVTFAEGLQGTILLHHTGFMDDADPITIAGDGRITLRRGTQGLLMWITPGTRVSLTDLELTAAGPGVARSTFGILNKGEMDLTRVDFSGVNADVGILNEGRMTLVESTIRGVSGAGLVNHRDALMTVERSTISGNSSGGINNRGTLVLINSTVSGNTSRFYGAGITNDNVLMMSHTTVTGNHSTQEDGGGGAGLSNTNIAFVVGSIISGNTAGSTRRHDDIKTSSPGMLSGLGNLYGTVEAPQIPEGNLVGVTNPRLGPLADNGGPTLTHEPMPDSPAIGLAPDLTIAMDQRGRTRREIGSSDAGSVEAPVVLVTTLVDVVDPNDGMLSLREAIDVSASQMGSDVITFAPSLQGRVLLTGELLLDDGSGQVTILGGGRITLDANRQGRVVRVLPGTTARLEGLTLTGGDLRNRSGRQASSGGAIFNAGDLSLVRSSIVANRVAGTNADGGGIFNNHGTLSLVDSTVSGNVASNNGGAIGNDGGTLSLVDSILENNIASASGGAIDNRGGLVSIDRSIVRNNRATSQAGGVFNDGTTSTAHPEGGTLRVIASTFHNNQAGRGGAIVNHGGTAELTNATISGNIAFGDGGGLLNDGLLSLRHATVTRNVAFGAGNGLFNVNRAPVSALLINSIVSDNWIPNREDIAGKPVSGGSVGNLVGFGGGLNRTTNLTGLFPSLHPLSFNGGPTPTHAPVGFVSPAIDAAIDSLATPTDQRGQRRPQGRRADIGAFETSQAVSAFSTTSGSGSLSGTDSLSITRSTPHLPPSLPTTGLIGSVEADSGASAYLVASETGQAKRPEVDDEILSQALLNITNQDGTMASPESIFQGWLDEDDENADGDVMGLAKALRIG